LDDVSDRTDGYQGRIAIAALGAGAILTFAYSVATAGAKLQNPGSGNPVYTSSMIESFNRSGEQAALIKTSLTSQELGSRE